MVNPFLFDLIPTQEAFLKKFPFFWKRLNKSTALPDALDRGMHDHIIIGGHGRVGKYIGRVLYQLHLPYLVVESDAAAAQGDAGGGNCHLVW